ncbi:hypothetical protein C8F01DRAFT_1118903 [Mycena amicta]|nr:hypothetical protein C8F01DRAFT_1118903 [Mycena amicta]
MKARIVTGPWDLPSTQSTPSPPPRPPPRKRVHSPSSDPALWSRVERSPKGAHWQRPASPPLHSLPAVIEHCSKSGGQELVEANFHLIHQLQAEIALLTEKQKAIEADIEKQLDRNRHLRQEMFLPELQINEFINVTPENFLDWEAQSLLGPTAATSAAYEHDTEFAIPVRSGLNIFCPRNLCLLTYVTKYGAVNDKVFDLHYQEVQSRPAEKMFWENLSRSLGG